MYIIDMTHFLTPQGGIGPKEGPAREVAEFLGGIVVAASSALPAVDHVSCNRCKDEIVAAIAEDDAITWGCPGCKEAGVIRNWRGTLWDLSRKTTEH